MQTRSTTVPRQFASRSVLGHLHREGGPGAPAGGPGRRATSLDASVNDVNDPCRAELVVPRHSGTPPRAAPGPAFRRAPRAPSAGPRDRAAPALSSSPVSRGVFDACHAQRRQRPASRSSSCPVLPSMHMRNPSPRHARRLTLFLLTCSASAICSFPSPLRRRAAA